MWSQNTTEYHFVDSSKCTQAGAFARWGHICLWKIHIRRSNINIDSGICFFCTHLHDSVGNWAPTVEVLCLHFLQAKKRFLAYVDDTGWPSFLHVSTMCCDVYLHWREGGGIKINKNIFYYSFSHKRQISIPEEIFFLWECMPKWYNQGWN